VLLPWLVADPRGVQRHRSDTLWLRPGEVGAVLAARRYLNDGRLRIAVDGETWELAVERGVGRCARSDDASELRLSRAALGSLYLGGTGATVLARAGRVEGSDAAVLDAERLFAWPVAPWCQEMF
jgi:predicted acetyltransferase